VIQADWAVERKSKFLSVKNDFLVALNEYYVIKAVEKGLKHVR
jgi:hypothetical protein